MGRRALLKAKRIFKVRDLHRGQKREKGGEGGWGWGRGGENWRDLEMRLLVKFNEAF